MTTEPGDRAVEDDLQPKAAARLPLDLAEEDEQRGERVAAPPARRLPRLERSDRPDDLLGGRLRP